MGKNIFRRVGKATRAIRLGVKSPADRDVEIEKAKLKREIHLEEQRVKLKAYRKARIAAMAKEGARQGAMLRKEGKIQKIARLGGAVNKSLNAAGKAFETPAPKKRKGKRKSSQRKPSKANPFDFI